MISSSVQEIFCSHPVTHSSPVIQVCVLYSDLLLPSGHPPCHTFPHLSSKYVCSIQTACSHQGILPVTHSSPVIQVCVLNPDLLAAWHLVAGHQGCVALQVLPSRVVVVVHLAAQTSLDWRVSFAAQLYRCRQVHGPGAEVSHRASIDGSETATGASDRMRPNNTKKCAPRQHWPGVVLRLKAFSWQARAILRA